MFLFRGGLMIVIEKIKYIFQHFCREMEGNLAYDEPEVDFKEIERTRKKLVEMRFRKDTSEMSGSFDLSSVRRRIAADATEVASLREKTKQSVNKWKRPGEQTDSGSFDVGDLQSRMASNMRREADEAIEPLPPVEDTFMAFSKPEHNFFADEAPSLKLVHCQVDPLEELEDEYRLPALPFFAGAEPMRETDIFIHDEKEADDQSESDRINATANNPMVQVLGELETRMAENRKKGAYWVESGDD